jgi:hypothetical protein
MSMMYIGIATVVVSAIGTGISVYGQNQAANAAEDAAARQAHEGRLQARSEAERAAENARRAEQEKSRLIARQRAELAGAGMAMTGTPLAILGDSALTLELDILDIGHASAQRQRALKAGARTAEIEGNATASALRLKAVATGVQGAASAAGGYGQASGYLN